MSPPRWAAACAVTLGLGLIPAIPIATTGSAVLAAIGTDVSSQSGYTSSSKVSFSFASTRDLCGTTDYPGADKNTGLLVGKA
jgi:hypothetical protein